MGDDVRKVGESTLLDHVVCDLCAVNVLDLLLVTATFRLGYVQTDVLVEIYIVIFVEYDVFGIIISVFVVVVVVMVVITSVFISQPYVQVGDEFCIV